MPQERYSMSQAEQMLQTRKSTLNLWIQKAGLSETIKAQRMPDDMREHWLTREQLEMLAGQHRRVLAETPAPDIEAVESDLSERLDALEAWKAGIERRLSALEGKPGKPDQSRQ